MSVPMDRRSTGDRRRRRWWSVLYGGFRPRRRRPPRRREDEDSHATDWHDAHLLGVSLGIVLLSVLDAAITLRLIENGAIEVNPLMAMVVYRDVASFAMLKLALTGCGVLVMVPFARRRLLGVVRVDALLYAVLGAYVFLIAYEFHLLDALGAHLLV